MPTSANFSNDELACKCCGQNRVNRASLDRLQRVRELWGKPLVLSSAYRCPKHDLHTRMERGQEGTGVHALGRAFDILVFGNLMPLLILLHTQGFTGIGISQKGPYGRRFVHVDDLEDMPGRPRPWVWGY